MMAISPLIGTAIENASEMHSIINLRLGISSSISNAVDLTKNGEIENQQVKDIIEYEMCDNVRQFKREIEKLNER